MIGITIRGPQQLEKLAAIKMPCGFGRLADASNPELSIADPFVSRRHVEMETTENDRSLLVRCVGSSGITLKSGEVVQPSEELAVTLPVEMRIGRTDVSVERLDLGVQFLKPPASQAVHGRQRSSAAMLPLTREGEIAPDRLIEWFEGLIAFQASVIGAVGFFEQAARAVVEMIGVDRCVVINCEGEWTVEVEYGAPSTDGMIYSHHVVGQVLAYRQTAFSDGGRPSTTSSEIGQQTGSVAFVGAPIFGADGSVVACLFAARNVDESVSAEGIRPLEAQLVQVAASVVGGRLARLAAEAEQTRTQVQLEQFASPQLVREMQSNPQWLDAQQRELTLLFGDIRGFSKLGESLEAQEIYDFVRDVMDCMTHVIHDHGGFVFNFAGDGIAAMWNAPGRVASHAEDACYAAVAIQKALQEVDQRWARRVGRAVEVGVGVNTGEALVGNSGSKARLKYSPLGHAVNLASRIEGATKAFGVPVLVTEATRSLVGDGFSVRDLGEIVVVGIDHPTRVFQLASGRETKATDEDTKEDTAWWSQYEDALHHFEAGEVTRAAARIEELRGRFPDDGPLAAFQMRIADDDGRGRPWVLSGK
jgi:adenylate cyclase